MSYLSLRILSLPREQAVKQLIRLVLTIEASRLSEQIKIAVGFSLHIDSAIFPELTAGAGSMFLICSG
jgi:hypothetical protein